LIELVIVITILAILAAVAIPAFQNLTQQARNAGTQGAVGGVRSAIAVFRANQIAGPPNCDPGAAANTDCYPTLSQLTTGNVLEGNIIPVNPWAVPAGMNASLAALVTTATAVQATVARTASSVDAGWRYYVANDTTPNGIFYANSATNGGTAGTSTENNF